VHVRPLLLLIALAAAGCQAPPPAAQYPVELAGEFAQFPMSVAGFRRDRVLSYAPGEKDVSVRYDLRERGVQAVSTLYFYEDPRLARELEAQFVQEKSVLERDHPGAQRIAEERLTLHKAGQEYPALRASYRYVAEGGRAPLRVHTELVLWKVGARYVKLRSTTLPPFTIGVRLRNQELLDAIDWTRPPEP
jgi:hypothetical protein